jgi:hypothetical protein
VRGPGRLLGAGMPGLGTTRGSFPGWWTGISAGWVASPPAPSWVLVLVGAEFALVLGPVVRPAQRLQVGHHRAPSSGERPHVVGLAPGQPNLGKDRPETG